VSARNDPRPGADPPRTFAVARASIVYYASHALLLAAGLISLPLTTRLLSKAEYGVLSLAFASIAVLTLVAGLGLGSAAMRLYHEAAARGPGPLRELCEGLVTGVAVAAAIVAAATMVVVWAGLRADSPSYAACLAAGSLLVVVRAISGVVYQIHRAQERALTYAAAQLAIRYGTLVVAVSALWLGSRTALTVIVASIAVEAVVLGTRIRDLHRCGLLARPRLPPVLCEALRYGLPLAAAGSSRFLLDYGDRFVIEQVLGLEAVAAYTVPSDFLGKLVDFVSVPMQLAAVPVLFRLWSEAGHVEATRAASSVLSYTVAFLVPVGCLYPLFDEALVVALASAKYSGAGELTPYILPGILLGGINFVTIVGMTIGKHTVRVALCVLGAAILNFVLNLALVSRWGLAGAGIATTIAYAALVGANLIGSHRVIALRLRLRPIANAAIATAVTVAATALAGGLNPAAPFPLLATVAAMALSALAIQALLDIELRALLRRWQSRAGA